MLSFWHLLSSCFSGNPLKFTLHVTQLYTLSQSFYTNFTCISHHCFKEFPKPKCAQYSLTPLIYTNEDFYVPLLSFIRLWALFTWQYIKIVICVPFLIFFTSISFFYQLKYIFFPRDLSSTSFSEVSNNLCIVKCKDFFSALVWFSVYVTWLECLIWENFELRLLWNHSSLLLVFWLVFLSSFHYFFTLTHSLRVNTN